ncbi:hypothetical protein MUP01_02220 [Candidatus Bathyarchaeota archaeon]|nr:hypothetical protein [Candidatus Bathyarchaeota archaeon]
MSTNYLTSQRPLGIDVPVASILTLCSKLSCAVNAAALSTPRFVPVGLSHSAGKRKGRLYINRIESGAPDAAETLIGGTCSVWGVDLVNPEVDGYGPAVRTSTTPSRTRSYAATNYGCSDVERFCLATAAATVTTTRLTYTAFSNYNWMIIVHKVGAVTKSGTLAGTQGKVVLFGANTKFLSELYPGMKITIGGAGLDEVYTVQDITSDVDCTLCEPLKQTSVTDAFTGRDIQLMTYDSTTAANTHDDKFKVATAAGLTTVTLGCNRYSGDVMPVGTVIDVYKCVPREVVADGVHAHEAVTAALHNIMWVGVAGSATTNAGVKGIATPTDVTIEGGLGD